MIFWGKCEVKKYSMTLRVEVSQKRVMLILGSWTFTKRELDLLNSSDAGIVDYYVENDAWEMLGVSVKRTFNEYPGFVFRR